MNMNEIKSAPGSPRKSATLNQEYKNHLNELSKLVDRLEKFRRFLFPIEISEISLAKTQPTDDIKKILTEPTFLESWRDHSACFGNLLDRLEQIVQELEQF
jgi:hypothetical protein